MREEKVFLSVWLNCWPSSLWEHVNRSKRHPKRLRKVANHVRMEDMPVLMVEKEDPDDVERVGLGLFESGYYGPPGSLESTARPREKHWFLTKGPMSNIFWGIRYYDPDGKRAAWLANKYEEREFPRRQVTF